MELVSSAIVEPVVNVLTGHITQKLRNLTSSADRVKEMKEKMKVLDGHRIDNEKHLRANRGNNKEIPARVPGWLEEVENIKKEVEKIPSNDIGCFNVKKKYRAGKNALAHIKDIDRLMTEEITWTDAVILTSSADRVKEMKDKMKVLDCRRIDNENHFRRNRENNLEIPARVPGWLKEVEDIKEEVEKIPSNDIGCFNVKKKYLAGKNALAHIKDIDRLMTEEITWTDAVIPLGRVDSERLPSTSTSTSGGNTEIVFKSRDKIFDDAMKFLQQDDDKPRVIALCGMGGVGKTTLMKQLKKAAEDNKMFNWIVVVTVGKTSNLFAIQNAIAEHIGKSLTKSDENLKHLTETDEKLRAAYLSKRFKELLKDNKKILVILDDVWEKIKLEDIGLVSPLPNGVKLLLTSRDVKVCRQIADDAAFEVVEVVILKEIEAQDFFCQKAGISAEHDHDLYKIGCEIVKKCGCLPLAIELIAGTLKCEKKWVWEHTLSCLMINDLGEEVQEIIEISYKNLKREEDKAIFLLCGLFPEDYNIPIEDLTKYAWGLELLKQVYTMGTARNSTQTSVSSLKNKYLLMDGDSDEYVKMHDLVLAFAVATGSKGGKDGRRIIIHHEDDFCKQLSLTCKDMQKLQVLEIINCKSMTEVFETQEINNKSDTDTGNSLPRLEYITPMLKLPKLKILKIQWCNLLEHIFTFSTLQSLTQLEELVVKDCMAMEVIVMEENGEQTTVSDVVVFPRLKSLELVNLPNFVGFFLGKNEFIWPTLENVLILQCPQITVSGPITEL